LPRLFLSLGLALCGVSGSAAQTGAGLLISPQSCRVGDEATRLGLVARLAELSDDTSFRPYPERNQVRIDGAGGDSFILDLSTGARIRSMRGPGAVPDERQAASSDDGRYLLVAGDESNPPAQLWDLDEGRLVVQIPDIDRGKFSRDGTLFASVKRDNVVVIYETHTGKRIAERTLPSRIGTLSFSRDRRRLFAFQSDAAVIGDDSEYGSGGLAIFDTANGATILEHFETDSAAQQLWKMDHAGTRLLETHVFRALFDAETGKVLARAPENDRTYWFASFRDDGAFVVAHDGEQKTSIIDAASGRRVQTFDDVAWDRRLYRQIDVGLSPDHRTAVIRRRDGTASLVSLATGQVLARLGAFSSLAGFLPPPPVVEGPGVREVPEIQYACCAPTKTGEFVFSWDGSRLITRDASGNFALWDTRRGSRIAQLGNGAIYVSPSIAWLVIHSDKEPSALWNVANGRKVATLGNFKPATIGFADPETGRFGTQDIYGQARIFYPDFLTWWLRSRLVEKRLLIVEKNGTSQVWDTASGRRFPTPDVGGGEYDWWMPGNRMFLLGQKDKSSQLWDASGGRLVAAFGEAPFESTEFYQSKGHYWLRRRHDDGDQGQFELWDISRGEKILSCNVFGGGNNVYETRDGLLVRTLAPDKRSTLWRVRAR